MSSQFIAHLVDAASERYRGAGHFAFHFARGKLGGDPAFAGLLKHGLVPDGARILDLGCGQGLLASWLLAARQAYETGHWPTSWPPAPKPATLHGIELRQRDVERAQAALGKLARFTRSDMCHADFGSNDVVVILDVLHYVGIAQQDLVLQRARDSLAPTGRLLLRVGDANGGLAFLCSAWVDQVVTLARGLGWSPMFFRPLAAWQSKLKELGFSVRIMPMNQGTPFANVLLIATLA